MTSSTGAAMALARELAEGPQVAMRLLKRSIYSAAELAFPHALDDIAADRHLGPPPRRHGGCPVASVRSDPLASTTGSSRSRAGEQRGAGPAGSRKETTTMRIGAVYPQIELGGDPEAVRRIAIAVEDLGFDHLMVFDHVAGADHDGRDPKLWGPYTDRHPFHDPFVMFGHVAAITARIELVTGVLILPQRQTVLVARQAADVASPGFQHHFGGTGDRLPHKRSHHVARQSHPHAAIREHLDHHIHKRRAGSGRAHHRIEQLLIETNRQPHCISSRSTKLTSSWLTCAPAASALACGR